MSPSREARDELRPTTRPIFLRKTANTGFAVGVALGLAALVLLRVWWGFR